MTILFPEGRGRGDGTTAAGAAAPLDSTSALAFCIFSISLSIFSKQACTPGRRLRTPPPWPSSHGRKGHAARTAFAARDSSIHDDFSCLVGGVTA
jgi:hypothetical protein